MYSVGILDLLNDCNGAISSDWMLLGYNYRTKGNWIFQKITNSMQWSQTADTFSFFPKTLYQKLKLVKQKIISIENFFKVNPLLMVLIHLVVVDMIIKADFDRSYQYLMCGHIILL